MLNVPSLISKTIQFLIGFMKYFACCNQKLDGGKAWEQGYNTGPTHQTFGLLKSVSLKYFKTCMLFVWCLNIISAWELYTCSKPCACMLILLVPVRFV